MGLNADIMAQSESESQVFYWKRRMNMSKLKLGRQPLLYPLPVLLIGSNVDSKPNLMTAAWGSLAGMDPPMACVAIRHARHTNKGIKQNNTFSINIPSREYVVETDYCGITPGVKVDKISACKFDVFYGDLKTAPMIEQCPVNLECAVAHIIDLGSHDLFIGSIEEVYINEDCLTNDKPDVNKIKPLTYISGAGISYRQIGKGVAMAFSVGKDLKTK
jgi:flavin reductase (DIM6/NTAB) family NADH-FMN oxidoreductase RutF